MFVETLSREHVLFNLGALRVKIPMFWSPFTASSGSHLPRAAPPQRVAPRVNERSPSVCSNIIHDGSMGRSTVYLPTMDGWFLWMKLNKPVPWIRHGWPFGGDSFTKMVFLFLPSNMCCWLCSFFSCYFWIFRDSTRMARNGIMYWKGHQ